jgi:hypothetical protein
MEMKMKKLRLLAVIILAISNVVSAKTPKFSSPEGKSWDFRCTNCGGFHGGLRDRVCNQCYEKSIHEVPSPTPKTGGGNKPGKSGSGRR